MKMTKLVKTSIDQYHLTDDILLPIKVHAVELGLHPATLCMAMLSGKLQGIRVGQGGKGTHRQYNNETSRRWVKEWRENTRTYRKKQKKEKAITVTSERIAA